MLLTHGDTFDDFILKPYHGIALLENTGSYPYVEHQSPPCRARIGAMAADIDGDGDLDIAAPRGARRRRRRDELPRSSGWNRRRPANLSVARSSRTRRRTRRWTSATWTATASQTSPSAGSPSAREWARGWTSGGTRESEAAHYGGRGLSPANADAPARLITTQVRAGELLSHVS